MCHFIVACILSHKLGSSADQSLYAAEAAAAEAAAAEIACTCMCEGVSDNASLHIAV
jgi:dsRNA-specific ribonuclease